MLSDNQSNVFIVGTMFCGSTLLGTALNQHPSLFHAGEIAYLDAFYESLHGRKPSHPAVCFSCGFAGVPCPTWTPEVIRNCEEAGIGGVHRYLRSLQKAPVLIDGSKLVAWLGRYILEAKPDIPTKVIISVRNPFAYLTSARMYYKMPAMQAAQHWRDEYWNALCTCAAINLDYIIVRHEDFMTKRVATIDRLCRFLGVDPLPEMCVADYPPTCALGGNPGVAAVGNPDGGSRIGVPVEEIHRKRTGHGVLDVRWKSELSREDIETLAYVPHLHDTAALLGYNLPSLYREFLESRPSA